MVTIKQIAEEAGVSRGTVDRVINHRAGVNPDTEKKVRKIAEQLGYQPSVPGKMLAAKKKKIEIGFIIYDTPVALFFQDIYAAAKEKAMELERLGVKVRFYKAESLEHDYLVSFLEKVEREPLDGLIISPLHLPAITSFLKKMEKINMPMVFYNLDEEESNCLCYVGCDYKKAGRVAAGLVALSIGNCGKVGIATVLDKKSPSSYERMTGFKQEIGKNYPDIEIINDEEHVLFGENDYSEIINTVRLHKDLKAMYIINPGDCNIYSVVLEASENKGLKIVTNDLLKRQRELLGQGVITATIDQQPDVQGTLPLQILYDYLVFDKKMEKNKIFTELHIYIQQNL